MQCLFCSCSCQCPCKQALQGPRQACAARWCHCLLITLRCKWMTCISKLPGDCAASDDLYFQKCCNKCNTCIARDPSMHALQQSFYLLRLALLIVIIYSDFLTRDQISLCCHEPCVNAYVCHILTCVVCVAHACDGFKH